MMKERKGEKQAGKELDREGTSTPHESAGTLFFFLRLLEGSGGF